MLRCPALFITRRDPALGSVDRARSEADRRPPRHDSFPPALLSCEAPSEVAENYHPIESTDPQGAFTPSNKQSPGQLGKRYLRSLTCDSPEEDFLSRYPAYKACYI